MHLAQIAQQSEKVSSEILKESEKCKRPSSAIAKGNSHQSYLLCPPLLDEMGLSSALAWYIEGLKERSGISIHLNILEDFGRVPRDMELVMFRLVQECLTNIHRHSGATSASIRIERSNEIISVEVADNGRGMAREKLLEVQTGGYDVGLRGIRERVRQSTVKCASNQKTPGLKFWLTSRFPKRRKQRKRP